MLRSPALRQLAFRRFESSAANKATEAAKETAGKAKEYQAKAAQGLSRVAGAAGPAIAGAARGLTSALSKVGGRTGKLISFIESMSRRLPCPEDVLSRIADPRLTLNRANSSGRLLRQGRPRDGQDCLPRPEDEPSVSDVPFSVPNDA
jgi:hypothetical protein